LAPRLVEVDRVEFLEDFGDALTLCGVAHDDRYNLAALTQIALVPTAFLLWGITAEQPVPKTFLTRLGDDRVGCR
jgi:hypothetical protein